MKKEILFVGEDPSLWREFDSQMPGPKAEWMAQFARTAPEAVALTRQYSFAAVVADARLAEASGVDLLDEIMRRQPRAMRIVLSDIDDTQSTLKCVGGVHHHLLKPCDASTLLNALEQATALEIWLPSEAVQGFIGQMRRLPSPPTIYFKVAAEMQTPDSSVEKVAELISQDPAIAVKILQLANSAVFGLQLQVTQLLEAITYIGMETTKALVLLAHTFSSFDKLDLAGFSVEQLWRHSVRTGDFARRIATAEDCDPETIEQAFAAGLLHDLGKLLLGANLPETFGDLVIQARQQQRCLWEAEANVLGVSHAELGGCMLGIWGLPKPIVEAVALHHFPARIITRGFTPLTAVHVANMLEHELHPDPSSEAREEVDILYLADIGLHQRLPEWKELCAAEQPQEG